MGGVEKWKEEKEQRSERKEWKEEQSERKRWIKSTYVDVNVFSVEV